MKAGHARWLLAAVFVLGVALRLTGFDRGFDGDSFHTFHPDEETVARAALELASPLDPPLTAYGLLPLYLARGAFIVAGVSSGDLESDPWPAYRALRLLAVILSGAAMVGVFLLSRRLFDEATAVLAALFLAVVPVAVQQGHFYTVDAVFLLCVTTSLYALARVEGVGTWRSGAIVGFCVGLAAATRLNGLLLLPVAVASLWLPRGRMTSEMRRDALIHPLVTIGTALAVVVVLQPYLVVSPELMWRDESSDDFWFSARIASGERLRLWSLYDWDTIPYLHHVIALLPLGIGWPLTLAVLGGVALSTSRWRSRQGALLLWSALFFLVMGGLHTKHVRYLLPLCRRYGRLAVAGVGLFTVFYGTAFARIYLATDSRIEAARWLATNVPAGAAIGLETGGFSLRRLVDPRVHDVHDIDAGTPFHLRGHLSCGAAAHHLADGLRDVAYVAVVDVNRHAQVTAAPDLLPATASFYRALRDERLGYSRVGHFRTTPGLAGIHLDDAGGEPSFLGYDHPAVSIYQRQAGAGTALNRWRDGVAGGTCPDEWIVEAVARAAAGDIDGAFDSVNRVRAGERAAQTGLLMEADLHRQRGDQTADEAAFRRYQEGYFGADEAHLIPWATSLTLTRAGAPDLALTGLMAGLFHVQRQPTPSHIRRAMTRSYHKAADLLQESGQPRHASRAREMAAQLEGVAGL